MPIIVETPQPPMREAITITGLRKVKERPAYSTEPVEKEVLDPSTTRDAEPEDLERAGWVRVEDVGRANSRTERAERERDEAVRSRDEARAAVLVGREAHDSTIAAEREACRERDEAMAEALSLREERDKALRERGDARWERDEAREALATMTRQRDDATALASRLRCDLDRATDREDGLAAERARCVAWLRAEANRSDEGDCVTESEWSAALRHAADRLERGEHAGTPVPAPLPRDLPRATDEELCALADDTPDTETNWPHVVALRVAARVRREQCLVTRAVAPGSPAHVELWDAINTFAVASGGSASAISGARMDAVRRVEKALAHLLGEVTRG